MEDVGAPKHPLSLKRSIPGLRGVLFSLVVAYRNGAPVRLRDIGSVVDGVENDKVARWYNKTRAIVLAIQKQPGTDTVEVVDAIRLLLPTFRSQMPASITTSFQGTAQAFQASLKGLGILLLMAILVIHIALGVLYESFIHPLTILSGLPAAGLGALLALLLFRLDLNLYAFVGVIMLIGIVKKNAIMMIDFALEAERKEGKGPTEAILEGCLIRFRPIMMTTMSALMATLPIAVGYGAGGGIAERDGDRRRGRPALLPVDHPVPYPGRLRDPGPVAGGCPQGNPQGHPPVIPVSPKHF
ncbi:MAG: efflux RND transporter permease subunit [Candidatus Deferrimicrobium sp.]